MAKAINARRSEAPKVRNPEDWRFFWFMFPMVVTTGKLMLIDSTASSPVPQEVNHVTFQRELKSSNVKGLFSLSFISQQHLENFISENIDPVLALASDLVVNRSEFVKDTQLPWTD